MTLAPTEKELRTVKDLASAAKLAGLKRTAREALLVELGDVRCLKQLATIKQQHFDETVEKVQVRTKSATRDLTALEKGQAGQLFRIAGTVIGVKPPAGAAAPSLVSSPNPKNGLKLEKYVDQGSNVEIAPATASEVDEAFFLYEKVMGKPPPTDEEPTSEQFAAFAYIIDNNLPPYVDFGVFGPYNGRFQLQQKFVTHRWTADGKWLPVQLKGPKNHDEWLKSWKVYETLCIMKDVASLATLRQVETKIRKLNDRFGIDHWGFIWEAYDHGMKEQLERGRRKADAAKAKGRINEEEYSPTRPWDYIISEFVNDYEWWNEEVVQKVLFQRNKTNDSSTRTAPEPPKGTRPRPEPREDKDKVKEKGKDKDKSGKSSVEEIYAKYGIHMVTKEGKRICGWGFREGACPAEPCKRDNAHVCHFCLSADHRTINCPQKPHGWVPPPPPQQPRRK